MSASPPPLLVFVFGTLKEGFPNFASNKGVRMPGEFVTKLRMPLYLVGERHSPWLVYAPGEGHHVAGQVFEVDAAALAEMDALERTSEPDGYRRVSIEVLERGEPSRVKSVFAYLKLAEHFSAASARHGPLPEYGLEHAALYRSRTPSP